MARALLPATSNHEQRYCSQFEPALLKNPSPPASQASLSRSMEVRHANCDLPPLSVSSLSPALPERRSPTIRHIPHTQAPETLSRSSNSCAPTLFTRPRRDHHTSCCGDHARSCSSPVHCTSGRSGLDVCAPRDSARYPKVLRPEASTTCSEDAAQFGRTNPSTICCMEMRA